MVDTNTGTRGVQIIDTSQLDVATATDRGTGSQNHAYKADDADMKLEYDNNWSSKNNCVSARSREKINFTGVDSITIAIDNFGGSTASDDQLFYVAVKVDESQKLDKTVQPVASQINSKITYTSSDESIATVDNFGVVTGHKEGKAVITAAANGITDTANVIVDNSAVTPTKPTVPNPSDSAASETKPIDSSDSAASETTPLDSSGNGTQINNNADAVQTGGIILTAILFALIISAAAVIYMKKRKNKI